MQDMYKSFKTDKGLEQAGVYLDYGKFRVKVARAGGSNKAFQRMLEAKLRPFQRAIKTETIDPELAEKIMLEVYAKTIVLAWETKVKDEATGVEKWEPLMQTVSGEMVKPSAEELMKLFKALPDLFADIQDQAGKAAVFREEINEANAGN